MIMKLISFTFLVICLITISITESYAFRCGDEIVSRWDSASDIVLKCGQPFLKEFTKVNDNGKIKYGEKWFYNCGESDFVYAVIIVDNKVFREEPTQRGKGKSQCHP